MHKKNDLRAMVEQNEPIFGGAAATFSPSVVETLGAIGMDFVWVDFEHGGPSPYDSTVLENLTRAAEAADSELLVRIPAPDPHLIRKVLDAGVKTILISRIETATEVRRAAEAAHFVYEGEPGERGIGIGRTTTWGDHLDSDYVGREDDSILLGAMIENQTAVENIDRILSVSGLGFVFIGPADLSVSLGYPMERSQQEVQDAVERVREAVVDSSVALGGIRNDPSDARDAIESGYQVLRIGGDLSSIRETLLDRLREIEDR